ncbi:MAG: A/G-specific adenine glycosylase [Anaerolineae bacterium]
MVNPTESRQIAESLLNWAKDHPRDLPWRRDRTPYATWISEVMLQQTQVATAIPYFTRWMQRFPDISSLAAASLDDVLKAWEGLGYYARARHLHQAARLIVERHGGRIPDRRDALLALPGIGPYTAGAILSLAYGKDEPLLDGNVRRVLCRIFDIDDDPSKASTERRLWDLATQLLPPGRAGEFNEALMDLGATVCTPRAPNCEECPVRPWCLAADRGTQEARPARRRRRTIPHYQVTAAIIWRDGQVLIAQRPTDAMLGGLWEFPGGKQEPGEALEACLRREIAEELGIEIEVNEPLPAIEHAYSHFRITLHPFHCRIVAGEPRAIGCTAWRWVRPSELGQFALSAADRRIVARLEDHPQPQEG